AARRRAEIGGGLDQALVEPRQAAIERQDHKRQVGVDETERDRETVVKERQRRFDQPKRKQQPVDEAARLKDRDPGVDADQKARPDRQHGVKQQQQTAPNTRAGDLDRNGRMSSTKVV